MIREYVLLVVLSINCDLRDRLMRDAADHYRILIQGGSGAMLINFRGPLIKALLAAGHQVVAGVNDADEDVKETLASWGVGLRLLQIDRAGMNPLSEWRRLAS